jgi:serine/threonine-protein kinase
VVDSVAPEAGEHPAMTAVEPSLPRRFGRYILVRELAKGGMAELYLALHRSHTGLDRLVVVKRILPGIGHDAAFVEMLLREARIAATFSHPNIVSVFDVAQAEGEYFIAMEHILGEDLRAVVRAMKPKRVTEFPLEHCLAIALGASEGLAYAHEKRDHDGSPMRIVHRDISPQNIVVTFDGEVKLVDFGIAKATISWDEGDAEVTGRFDRDELDIPDANITGSIPRITREHVTAAGKLKGKLPYMSPEQARAESLDGRSDVFSLGIILWELCTGRRLFRGGNEQETYKLVTSGAYPRAGDVNPRISPALSDVIMKALAADRAQRYDDARAFHDALESVVRDEGMVVSNLALAAWMRGLFAERTVDPAQQLREARLIAARLPDLPKGPPKGVSAPPVKVRPSGLSPRRVPGAAPAWLPVAAMAVVVLVALAVRWLLVRR